MRRIVGSRENFQNLEPDAFDPDAVGKSAPGIDCDAQRRRRFFRVRGKDQFVLRKLKNGNYSSTQKRSEAACRIGDFIVRRKYTLSLSF